MTGEQSWWPVRMWHMWTRACPETQHMHPAHPCARAGGKMHGAARQGCMHIVDCPSASLTTVVALGESTGCGGAGNKGGKPYGAF